ncbi:hypothetical protein JXA32_16160 [Candidatus Sumerlaeota bacterium]|nr:hypothetical protein [Candidatus Sumerlaeota bacterium]
MRKTGIAILIFVIIYFGVLPMFWPKPAVEVVCPSQFNIGEDLEVTVSMSAWHPMFHINQIRFYPDLYKSSALSASDPLYAMLPYSAPPKRYGHGDMLKRFTWPVTRVKTVTVPLSGKDVAGKIQPGEITGKFDVNFTYANYVMRLISTRESSVSIPFTIKVHPAK